MSARAEEHPVLALRAAARRFGSGAAAAKLELLDRVDRLPRLSRRRALDLQAALCFLRAHPDDARVRRRADRSVEGLRARIEALADEARAPLVNSGLPGTHNSYAYSHGIAAQLFGLAPGSLEIDWDELPDQTALLDGLGLLVSPGEYQGLEDIHRSMEAWVRSSKTDPDSSDLALVLDLFERSRYDGREREFILETCDLPIRYALDRPGSGLCELAGPWGRRHYQRAALGKERFPLAPRIRRPPPRPRRLEGEEAAALVELAVATLCCRNLEIYPLTHADRRSVLLVECGRGVAIALVGVRPEMRSSLESLHFVFLLKNGVPVGYGPAAVCAGCCEMGLNLFPEFRGGEVRSLYAQFMRVLHHLLAVDTFFLTSYGMGEENPEAIRSGAFWFYRHLGFAVSNPEVEAIAQREEAAMRADPSHRSSVATLRRMSRTGAWFALGAGPRRPIDLGGLGVAETRYVAARFGGDRRRAASAAVSAVRRALGVGRLDGWSDDERRALAALAPVLAMIPGLARWSVADRRAVARFLRAKGATSEAAAAGLLARHRRLLLALDRLAIGRVP